ncbi:mechanosensitive ion channel family protein [Bacillus sp. 2205SS5-2]|uniref:mechanosensitive ion channel family protein n=1 Tax=Bacillus sp. 2205SS5-2 TaxID=3109031 RepID=UPI0030045468
MEIFEWISKDSLKDLSISAGILVAFFIFRKIFTKYVLKIMLKLSSKARSKFFTHVFHSFENPIAWLFIIFGIFIAADSFPFMEQNNPLFKKIFRSLVILQITWGLFNLTSASSVLFKSFRDKYSIEMDEILIPFISKGLRFVVLAISFSIIAQEFEYDVNGFVAGLGLGGLAFALAAKDVIGNFFGGIIIITERPFSIGDWVETPSVEGTIEDISFRSTKIRTFEQAIVTVPNAILANEPITNWSKMGKRRITFNLGLTYNTPNEKIQRVVHRLEFLLQNHDEIHKETIFVRFNEFNTNSLDLFLYFFTNTTQWGEYLRVREEINFQILDILEEEEVDVAFPTRTLYVESQSEESPHVERSLST